MPKSELVFLDTSVLIARLLSGPSQRARVDAIRKEYLTASGLVCRQEFKRRVLRDAAYLREQLITKGFPETHAYMVRLTNNQYQKRRATICLHLLGQATGRTEQEKCERLCTRLRTLIVTGMGEFDGCLDSPAGPSCCACGRNDPRERRLKTKRTVFEFGEDKCGKIENAECGIVKFLMSRAVDRQVIRDYLATVAPERKSDELVAAEQFLASVDTNLTTAPSQNPCLNVGDLIIALESAAAGAKAFYTMNGKESQHLSKPLGQTLIVRPTDGAKDDIVCAREQAANWPSFG